MPQRTFFVRAKDVKTFQQFDSIIGGTGNFSDGIAGLVKKFVSEQSLIECIVTDDRGLLVTKAFRGRWLISLMTPYQEMPDLFEELGPNRAGSSPAGAEASPDLVMDYVQEKSSPTHYWSVAEGDRGGWFVLRAESQDELRGGPRSWWQLEKGPTDPRAKEIPASVIEYAQSNAARLNREEIDL